MARVLIKKAITTEKSFKNQDKNIWSFLVAQDANKIEIKKAIESLFGVEVATVNTSNYGAKVRRLGKNRHMTKRKAGKIARITLKGDNPSLDLTKLNK